MLGIQGKEAVEKEEKDYENDVRELSLKISENKKAFTVEKRMEENIQELTKVLRVFLEEDKNLSVVMNRMLSAQQSLPKDSANTFQ